MKVTSTIILGLFLSIVSTGFANTFTLLNKYNKDIRTFSFSLNGYYGVASLDKLEQVIQEKYEFYKIEMALSNKNWGVAFYSQDWKYINKRDRLYLDIKVRRNRIIYHNGLRDLLDWVEFEGCTLTGYDSGLIGINCENESHTFAVLPSPLDSLPGPRSILITKNRPIHITEIGMRK